MTINFLKLWEFPKKDFPDLHETAVREKVQYHLDGGIGIDREGPIVAIAGANFVLGSPAKAVKFAAALNKLRRPVRLLKQDLDADWAERVKARDNDTCVLCGVKGAKVKPTTYTSEGKAVPHVDNLNAHHWLKTKSRSGMARWDRPCGVTVHFAEHIHALHENPCWVDLDQIHKFVYAREPEGSINATIKLANVVATEARVRKAWFEMKQRELKKAE